MSEEKIKVLKLLEEKKISSGEALELIESLSKLEANDARPVESGGRFLRIRASESGLPAVKASISVPISWSGLLAPLIEQKICPKLSGAGREIDMEKLREALEAGEPGKIVDIADGDIKVEISIGR